MGTPKPPAPAKPILGLITREPSLKEEVKAILVPEWGGVELESEPLRFDFTDYYQAELGPELLRWWLSFEQTIPLERLPELKHYTNRLELILSRPDGRRSINLDPGYLTLQNLVLATTKPAPHRVYLGEGIYAELTLIYLSRGFKPLSWTYPDYRTEAAIRFFNQVRQSLKEGLRATRCRPLPVPSPSQYRPPSPSATP